MRPTILLLFCALFALPAISQKDTSKNVSNRKRELVQLSGVLVSKDSLKPVPFAGVRVLSSNRLTTSDYFGYFSFAALKGDTVMFSSIGYKNSIYVIPDTLTPNFYTLIHMMEPDTVDLPEVAVYPWPTKEQFEEAFLNLNLPDDATAYAYKNLSSDAMDFLEGNMTADGNEAFNVTQMEQNSIIYNMGQRPNFNVINPIAWAQFVDLWRKGKLKRQ